MYWCLRNSLHVFVTGKWSLLISHSNGVFTSLSRSNHHPFLLGQCHVPLSPMMVTRTRYMYLLRTAPLMSPRRQQAPSPDCQICGWILIWDWQMEISGLAYKLHAKKDFKVRNKKPANSALGTWQITELARVTVIWYYSTLLCNKDRH